LTGSALFVIERPLTGELADTRSPVRRFFDSGFSGSLRSVQSRYRHSAPALTVPPVQRTEADPGTVGSAADWLLRVILLPSPAPELAAHHSAPEAGSAAPGELAPAGPESQP
jgi:hypothetical protein